MLQYLNSDYVRFYHIKAARFKSDTFASIINDHSSLFAEYNGAGTKPDIQQLIE